MNNKIFRYFKRVTGPPYFWTMDRANPYVDMIYIHKQAVFRRRAEGGSYQKYLRLLTKCMIWPVRLVLLSIALNGRVGGVVKDRFGKNRLLQVAEQIFLALCYSLPPRAYYYYAFFQREQRETIPAYIYDHEVANIFPRLNGYRQQVEINNKRKFALLCEQANIPTVPVLAEVRGGKYVSLLDDSAALPQFDFFVKPILGSRGQGCGRWTYLAPDLYADTMGNVHSANEVVGALILNSLKHDLLVQPFLNPHAALKDLGCGTVSCARIITIQQPGEDVFCFCAVLKIPRSGQITNSNGIFAAIDLDSATLGLGYTYQLLSSGFRQHPDNGLSVYGFELPAADWRSALEMVCCLHQFFPGYLSLGWDVAFSDQGPLLLETNECWDVLSVQRAHGKPLGQTEFGHICKTVLAATR